MIKNGNKETYYITDHNNVFLVDWIDESTNTTRHTWKKKEHYQCLQNTYEISMYDKFEKKSQYGKN